MPEKGRTEAKAPDDEAQGKASKHGTLKELLRPEDLPQVLGSVLDYDHTGASDRKSARLEDLEVEIGCGNGHFMIEYCRLNPRTLFIGVEIKKKRCIKALAKIDHQNITNACVVYGSAEEALRYLSDGSVNAFHLYYPDPWPKSKHRRRRFLRRENIEILQRKLKTGGLIFFVTDFFDYYLHTKVLLLLQHGLELSSRVPSESIFQSMFAKRFLDMGKGVYRLAALKSGNS